MTEFAVWTTRDGQEIPLVELTDEHLQNVWRMLSEQRDDIIAALDAWEMMRRDHDDSLGAIGNWIYLTWLYLTHWLEALEAEKKRREPAG